MTKQKSKAKEIESLEMRLLIEIGSFYQSGKKPSLKDIDGWHDKMKMIRKNDRKNFRDACIKEMEKRKPGFTVCKIGVHRNMGSLIRKETLEEAIEILNEKHNELNK